MKINRKPGVHLHKTQPRTIDLGPAEWYWVLIAKNGKTIARSSETYKRKRSAVDSIRIAAKLFAGSIGMFGGHYFDHTGKDGVETNYYEHY